MPFGGVKVYFDGSHYIAIPHTTRPPRRSKKVIDEDIEIENQVGLSLKEDKKEEVSIEDIKDEINFEDFTEASEEDNQVFEEMEASKPKSTQISRRELFEMFYEQTIDMPKKKRKSAIIKLMQPYFKEENQDRVEPYVTQQLERKEKNMSARRTRCYRKANLQEFNYFVTVTYLYGQVLIVRF